MGRSAIDRRFCCTTTSAQPARQRDKAKNSSFGWSKLRSRYKRRKTLVLSSPKFGPAASSEKVIPRDLLGRMLNSVDCATC